MGAETLIIGRLDNWGALLVSFVSMLFNIKCPAAARFIKLHSELGTLAALYFVSLELKATVTLLLEWDHLTQFRFNQWTLGGSLLQCAMMLATLDQWIRFLMHHMLGGVWGEMQIIVSWGSQACHYLPCHIIYCHLPSCMKVILYRETPEVIHVCLQILASCQWAVICYASCWFECN